MLFSLTLVLFLPKYIQVFLPSTQHIKMYVKVDIIDVIFVFNHRVILIITIIVVRLELSEVILSSEDVFIGVI